MDNSVIYLNHYYNSFIIDFVAFKDTWLFNCFEGLQCNAIQNKCRVNKISRIFFTNLHINNISGLLGLLSSLNLIGRTKDLHLYGPKDLANYIDLSKKYSHTNFNYLVYIHTLSAGLVLNYNDYRIYCFFNSSKYNFLIMQAEKYGTFFLDKAKKNHLLPGPLYGKLKIGSSFILPDGYILEGYNFTFLSVLGSQLYFIANKYYKRYFFENSLNCLIIIH